MKASGYDRWANDYYVEPKWAIDGLLDVEPIRGDSHDPCCGAGNIPRAMIERGLPCHASEIANRGYGTTHTDFFSSPPLYCENIISNPPFNRMQDFVNRALTISSDKVIVLARLAFLESQSRYEWWHTVPLARVWISSRRMSMPPGGSGIKATGGTVAYAWFVFERGYTGKPVLGWFK